MKVSASELYAKLLADYVTEVRARDYPVKNKYHLLHMILRTYYL